jgi:hypothetical protein
MDLATGQSKEAATATAAAEETKTPEPEKPAGTTSRLLEAKKRAQKRRGQ